MRSSLDVLARDEIALVARLGPHVLVLWAGPATGEHANRVAQETLKAARAAPRHAAHVSWILPSGGVPDADAREVFIKMGRQLGQDLGCLLAVVGGDGFASAVFRATITGLAMAARIQFPLKLVADVPEGVAWVAERVSVERDGLAEALAILRAHYEAPAGDQRSTPR